MVLPRAAIKRNYIHVYIYLKDEQLAFPLVAVQISFPFLKETALSGHMFPWTGRFSLAVCRRVPCQHKLHGFCRFRLHCRKTVQCQWSKTVSKTCVAAGLFLMFEDLVCWRRPGGIARSWPLQALEPWWDARLGNWCPGSGLTMIPDREHLSESSYQKVEG